MSTQTVSASPPANLLSFNGVIDTVTHANPESGWAILKLRVDLKTYGHYPCVTKKGHVTLVGNIAHITIGQKIQVSGTMKNHKSYGPQIEVFQITISEPKTLYEIKVYLDKQVKSIGPEFAGKIVNKFGEDTIKIIDNEPDRLLEIKGIGKHRLEQIKATWQAQREYRGLLLFATNIGLSSKQFNEIYKKYENQTIEKIKEDPYRLSREIWGIGFMKADEVARHLGVHELSELRVRAAMEHLLHEAETDGHVFLFAQTLISKTSEFLNHPSIDEKIVGECLTNSIGTGFFKCERMNRIYLPEYARAEDEAVNCLTYLLNEDVPDVLKDEAVQKQVLEVAEASSSVKLAPQQAAALTLTLKSKVSVITGGPGTGKTTITKAVVAGFDQTGLNVILLAPTGRAAKRMTEVIGKPAMTIHRMLFGLCQKHINKRPEEYEQVKGIIIVDEFSMVDIKLFAWLLRWIHPTSILVIVGDKDQLPSVGAGAVLRDLLETGVIPCTQLTEIFRQAQGSSIIVNAHKINQGLMPTWDMFGKNHNYPTHSDMWVSMIEDAEDQAKAALWCATNIVPAMGMDPRKDCMVMAPMKNGACGVIALNGKLQSLINPDPPLKVDRGGGVWWGVGDKMMQTKNDYEMGVSNGEIGVITDMVLGDNDKLKSITVNFDGNEVTYPDSEFWNALRLTYACTVHKLQGSEFPAIIMCLHRSHYMLLQRNLLYTGVTRGRKLVILIASGDALSRAIGNNAVSQRNTSLADKISCRIK